MRKGPVSAKAPKAVDRVVENGGCRNVRHRTRTAPVVLDVAERFGASGVGREGYVVVQLLGVRVSHSRDVLMSLYFYMK